MALLKIFQTKLNGSSLIENLVASVIIMLVFVIASFSINNVLRNQTNSSAKLDNHVKELTYLVVYDKISEGYTETYINWNIEVRGDNTKTFLIVLDKHTGIEKKEELLNAF
ncbi:hypothetical protein [Zunongwangia sp.]|uniref:hypothetical protein n=1 Tax=Zunongwangia sp. TaxID=1965325 RepID=UPI003AA8A966